MHPGQSLVAGPGRSSSDSNFGGPPNGRFVAERRTLCEDVGAACKRGQPRQLYARPMATPSLERLSGHTPMMQHPPSYRVSVESKSYTETCACFPAVRHRPRIDHGNARSKRKRIRAASLAIRRIAAYAYLTKTKTSIISLGLVAHRWRPDTIRLRATVCVH